MKICYSCKQEKEETEYYFKNKVKNIRHAYCKDCKKKYHKKHYENNVQYYVSKAKIRNARVNLETRLKIFEYLKSHPCVDCGESDVIVLEFDHVRGKKRLAVSSLVNYGWKTVHEEIQKCEVRCSNCHTRKTAKQLGYYKYLDMVGLVG